MGDEVLKTVSRCLGSEARVGDTVARFDGKEFIIVLPACPIAHAEERAEGIRRSCAALAIRSGGTALSITVSIGIAGMPDHGDSAQELIAAADAALYAAKDAGRNRALLAPVGR